MIGNDERGLTTPLEYVFTFAIAAILVTGLIITATNVAGDQRQRTVEAQMNVVAQQVAGSLEAADRLVQSSDSLPDELSLEHELPDELLGGGYTVTVSSGPTPTITVSSSLASDTVTTTTSLEATGIDDEQNFQGGTVTIECGPSGCSELVIDNV